MLNVSGERDVHGEAVKRRGFDIYKVDAGILSHVSNFLRYSEVDSSRRLHVEEML